MYHSHTRVSLKIEYLPTGLEIFDIFLAASTLIGPRDPRFAFQNPAEIDGFF